MTENTDIRWHQRLEHLQKALSQLKEAVLLSENRPLANIETQGLIKAFEFTYELAWNVMKDYFEDQANISITGSRDAIREAFQRGLIVDGDDWMEMIKSRNQTSYTYNQNTAEEISRKIVSLYCDLFEKFTKRMSELKK